MIKINLELYVFFCSLWTGCIVSGVYMCIRIFRRIIKHSLLAVSIEDLLFWIFTSIYIYYQIFLSTKGVLRWYFFAGIVLGAWSIYTIWYSVEKIINKYKKST